MHAEELLERADRTASEMFAETGGLPEPRVWVYTKGQVTSIPCKPANPKAELQIKMLACAFIAAARRAGTFEGVVMVAEAWMSIGAGHQPAVPPSKDPARVEVLILLAYGKDGHCQCRARRILGANGSRRLGDELGEFRKDGMQYKTWLDAAFEDEGANHNGKTKH